MTVAELAGLGLFLIVFFGYARIADICGRGRNVNSLMHEVRRTWMQRLTERPDRIVEAALTGHTVNSMSFFSSATILVLLRRQVISHSARAIQRYAEINPRDGAPSPGQHD